MNQNKLSDEKLQQIRKDADDFEQMNPKLSPGFSYSKGVVFEAQKAVDTIAHLQHQIELGQGIIEGLEKRLEVKQTGLRWVPATEDITRTDSIRLVKNKQPVVLDSLAVECFVTSAEGETFAVDIWDLEVLSESIPATDAWQEAIALFCQYIEEKANIRLKNWVDGFNEWQKQQDSDSGK